MSSRRGGCVPANGSARSCAPRIAAGASPCSALLGLVVGVASGAWVWTSGTPKVRRPVVPVKTTVIPAKAVVRTMPAITRGIHVSEPWAGDGKPGYMDQVLAQPGLNLVQLDVKDESGEVAGLGRVHARARQEVRRRARLLRPRAHHAHRARQAHLGRGPHRQLQGSDHGGQEPEASRSTAPRAASGTTAAASPGSISTTTAPGTT